MGKNQTSHMITMKVCAILGAMLVASASAVASDASIGYEKEMAALEPDEWAPKQQGGKEGATELIQEGATTKVQPSPSETAFSENAGENGPTSLFPGPTYGLPGYKESHDWLKDLDWWSPLVFDWRYYKARCADGCNGGDALKDMGEGAIKKYWVDTGMDNDDIASPTFDCEYYVMQNDELHEELLDEEKKVMCKKAVEHFLTSGVFDGLGGSTFDGLVVTEGSDSKSAWKISGNKCLNGCVEGQIKWDQNYAWTFWYKRTTDNFDAGNRKVLPVFAVRAAPGDGGRHNPTGTRNGGWWGGYPFFVTWMGSMMFCASTDKWECHWPIGEENSGVKGGWRFNWYHRWRLPPANWWRFYGVMADENGYTLYEFSDPPILGNSVIGPDIKIQSAHHANRNEMATAGKAHPEFIHMQVCQGLRQYQEDRHEQIQRRRRQDLDRLYVCLQSVPTMWLALGILKGNPTMDHGPDILPPWRPHFLRGGNEGFIREGPFDISRMRRPTCLLMLDTPDLRHTKHLSEI